MFPTNSGWLYLTVTRAVIIHKNISEGKRRWDRRGGEVRRDWNRQEKKKIHSRKWKVQGRIEHNRREWAAIEKHEKWIGPWWYSHSICLSVGLHWYSGESSPSSSTYQKTVLWSINMPWESKLFSLIALVICPETVWKWEPALKPVGYESLVTFTREQKIRFLTFCGSAEPLILSSPSQRWWMRRRVSSPHLDSLEKSSCKKRKSGLIVKNVHKQLVPFDFLIDNTAVITNCVTFLS